MSETSIEAGEATAGRPADAERTSAADRRAAQPFPLAAPYFAALGDTRTNRERMLAGDWYVADDPENGRISAHARRELARYEHAFSEGEPDAVEHLRSAIPGLDPSSTLLPPVRVDYGTHIAVGPDTFANYGLTALDVAAISIGAHCQIGPNVQLLTPVHPLQAGPREAGLESADPITIGDNVWLGGGVIVCPGVTIGSNSVVGAGSVVTRDIPERCLAVGSPARVIRALDDDELRPRH